uniref:Uncharacterized protein n=1 Tax=Arundo donax TaxID=35708 RepID=A0A0A8YHR4_ARUDO
MLSNVLANHACSPRVLSFNLSYALYYHMSLPS